MTRTDTDATGAAPITVGPITLEPWHDDDTMPATGGDESLWGVCPHTGDAVFVIREAHLLADERATPWSACLWSGREDGRSAPTEIGVPRYATRAAALAAVARAVAARP